MSDRVYGACADVLMLAVTLPASAQPACARRAAPAAADRARRDGRQGALGRDLRSPTWQNMRYALVAFLDEQILKSNWSGRNEWMGQPLQLLLFNQHDAGETFFSRLNAAC